MESCWERIASTARAHESRICVGLDTEIDRLPRNIARGPDPLFAFNREVIDATLDLVCAFKPNMAFYEAGRTAGIEALARTIDYVGGRVPVILDAKRGDIGNTARAYARACFEWLGADAVTVSPFLGRDSVTPFMEHPGKGVFVLCLTSNPGSADFQFAESGGTPLHERVALKVAEWDQGRGCLGLVVGATHPGQVGRIRALAGSLPILLPGIGAQGGSLECVEQAEVPGESLGVVVNASRSIIYAGGGENFAEKIRAAALDLRNLVGGPGRKASPGPGPR